MSKPDPNKTEFHARVSITREEMQRSKDPDLIGARQARMAQEFGQLIAKTKGWNTYPAGDLHISELDLYIFTRNELFEYAEAMFKQRLLQMAEREEYLSDEQRQALRNQAERF